VSRRRGRSSASEPVPRATRIALARPALPRTRAVLVTDDGHRGLADELNLALD
jgi:hypothetical protein